MITWTRRTLKRDARPISSLNPLVDTHSGSHRLAHAAKAKAFPSSPMLRSSSPRGPDEEAFRQTRRWNRRVRRRPEASGADKPSSENKRLIAPDQSRLGRITRSRLLAEFWPDTKSSRRFAGGWSDR
jgi:hypothetical protein